MMINSNTESLCPHCLMKIPAKIVSIGNEVYLEKACPEHGDFKTILWRGEPAMDSWQRPKIPAKSVSPTQRLKRAAPMIAEYALSTASILVPLF
jgi:uncharacterized radical SAM superfamily Fe-S cluster-containing enzyme